MTRHLFEPHAGHRLTVTPFRTGHLDLVCETCEQGILSYEPDEPDPTTPIRCEKCESFELALVIPEGDRRVVCQDCGHDTGDPTVRGQAPERV